MTPTERLLAVLVKAGRADGHPDMDEIEFRANIIQAIVDAENDIIDLTMDAERNIAEKARAEVWEACIAIARKYNSSSTYGRSGVTVANMIVDDIIARGN